MKAFAICRPASIAEACAILSAYPEEAMVYAGGTELLTVAKLGYSRPGYLVDIKPVGDASIRVAESGVLHIGALASHRSLERSRVAAQGWPLLPEMEAQLGNIRIRNQGTVGGNVCFGEPHSDLATALLALEATLWVISEAGTRQIAAADFWPTAFMPAKAQTEVLERIIVPPLPPSTGSAYLRFAVVERPCVGVAVLISLHAGAVSEVRIAVGAATPVPARFPEVESRLTGLSAEELARMVAAGDGPWVELAAQLAADDDLYGTADYKRHLASVLVRRALSTALSRAAA